MSSTPLLDDPINFWDLRHAALDPWRSGGDRGLSQAENQEFYSVRMGKIVELIRKHASSPSPLSILDAGCGRGHFTEGLRKCGHRVVGIDSSQTAIAWAQETYGPHFACSELDAYAPRAPFDVVMCIDVLFHVVHDDVWRRSLDSFARYAAAESLLLVTDTFPEQRYDVRGYMVFRTPAEYEQVLREHGFELALRVPYTFGSNPVQYAAYRRTV